MWWQQTASAAQVGVCPKQLMRSDMSTGQILRRKGSVQQMTCACHVVTPSRSRYRGGGQAVMASAPCQGWE